MKRPAPRKRSPKVALRPQYRKARAHKIFSMVSVLILGTATFLGWARLKKSVSMIKKSAAAAIPSPKTVEIDGVPDSLKPEVLSFLNSQNPASWQNRSADIKNYFPFLKAVHLSRDFFYQRLVYHVVLRQAVAVVSGRYGRSFMDEGGVLFKAPKELYDRPVPEILDSDMDLKTLRHVAGFLDKIASLPLSSPIESLRYQSPVNGWVVNLQDGTRIDWGNLRWTKEKVNRLNAVLADAKTYLKGDFFIDMRSFENGKIFVKPSVSKALARRF